MQTYIAILRGINVGGKRIIKMLALKEMFITLGYQNIATYIQSGNVVLQSKKANPIKLAEVITNAISKTFGFDVPVIVFEYETLNNIVEENEFFKHKSKSVEHLHITFLADELTKENQAKIKREDYLPDEFLIHGKAIYLYCPNGYSKSKLTNDFFEKKLRVNATTRNWKTTLAIKEIANQIQ